METLRRRIISGIGNGAVYFYMNNIIDFMCSDLFNHHRAVSELTVVFLFGRATDLKLPA